MPNLHRWIVSVYLLTSAASAAAGITLTHDGKSDYVIAIANNAGLAERTAANNLADYIQKATGAKLPVVNESDIAIEEVHYISVGRTKLAEKVLTDVKWGELAHDGIVLRTNGNTLFLTGGQPRGTVYAVNTFLED